MLSGEDKALVNRVAEAAHLSISNADWDILGATVTKLSDSQKARLSQLNAGLMRGLLALFVDGYEFVPADRIEGRFGKRVSENYPEANELFRKFATSYITLLLWIEDRDGGRFRDEGHSAESLEAASVLMVALLSAKYSMQELFFPQAGDKNVNPDVRENSQRQLFRDYRASLDVDLFMAGNPILIRQRQAQRAGCLSAVVLALGASTTI